MILLPPHNSSPPKIEQQSFSEPIIKESSVPTPAEPESSNKELPKPPESVASPQQEEVRISNAAPTLENQPVKKEFRPLPADPIVESRHIQTAGQAQALLLIGEDGAVRQIIWNQLPAVTEEELLQMEQRLRQKAHLARQGTYTVAETIEIPRGQADQ